MGKSPCCEKNESVKKGPWTPEEDQKMMDYIQKHGHGTWRTLPKNAGLKRCGKSCRLRWTNYLRPDIKRGMFSLEEEDIIVQLHSIMGNKWSAIAARLPGRTDNEIKNYWNTHIRKRLLKMGIDPITHIPCLDLLQLSSILTSSFQTSPPPLNQSNFLSLNPHLINQNLLDFASSLLSSSHPPHNSSEVLVNNVLSSSLEENGCNPVEKNTIQSYLSNQIHNPTLENQLNTPSNTLRAPFWTGKPEQGYPDFNILGYSNSDMDWWEKSGEPKNLVVESLMSQPNLGFCDNFDQPFISTLRNQASMSNTIVDSQHSSFSSVPSVPCSRLTTKISSSTTCVLEDETGNFCNNVFSYYDNVNCINMKNNM